MKPMRYEDRLRITEAIRETQEMKKLREECEKLKAEKEMAIHTLNAVITAFFREGAPAPNVTRECWEGGRTYHVIENGEFYTIVRTSEEMKKERESCITTNGTRKHAANFKRGSTQAHRSQSFRNITAFRKARSARCVTDTI